MAPIRDTRRTVIAGASVLAAAGLVAVGFAIDSAATRDSDAEVKPGEPRACSEIGCDSGVFVTVTKIRHQLPNARRITLCAAGECRSFGRRIDGASVRLPRVQRERRVRVKLLVRDGERERLHRDRIRVRLRRFQPNGPGCPPVCYSCGLGLDADLNLRKRA